MNAEEVDDLSRELLDVTGVDMATAFTITNEKGRIYEYRNGFDAESDYIQFGIEINTGDSGITPEIFEALDEIDFEKIQNSLVNTGEFRVYLEQ